MKECYSTLPLNNKKLTDKFAGNHHCYACDDRYNCLLVSSITTQTTEKQWVVNLLNDVKADITAAYVIEKLTKNQNDAMSDPIVREHFISMIRDKYKKLKIEISVIKESLLEIGIDIDKEIGEEENKIE